MIKFHENTNSAILINTFILYGKLVVTMLCGLLTTRFALQAMGASDFGLYSVVASIIVFIGLLNTSMLSACNRFITAAVGRNNIDEINKTFNVTLSIHVLVAIITIVVLAPLGYLYIVHFVNYEGPIVDAVNVFIISILSSAVSFIWVPYNAILMARERFIVFCGADIIFTLIKLLLCYGLLLFSGNRLLAYAFIIAITTVAPGFIYYFYCKKYFREYIKPKFVRGWKNYKPILMFSLWSGYGALVQVGQVQCASLLINAFFNTLMNTALSITNYLKSAVLMVADNLTKSISPQITKNYSSGNIERCITLMAFISKISFIVTFLISTPFLFYSDYIITMWLGQVPEYSILFTRIVMITIIIGSFNRGIAEYVFATGNIKTYQLVTNTILFFSVLLGYIVLKCGAEAYWLLYIYMIFELLSVIVRQLILHYSFNFDNSILWYKSYLPSLAVIAFTIPFCFLKDYLSPPCGILTIFLYQVIVCIYVCFSRIDRQRIITYIKDRISID